MMDAKYFPKCVAVADTELSIPIFLEDDWIGTLFLGADDELSYEWSELWFTLKTRNPLSGVPTTSRERIFGSKVNWVFDNFYLPTSDWNLKQALLLYPFLDATDLSARNRRLLLFVTPYRKYGISLGAPCSHFDHCLGTSLKPKYT